MGSTSRDRDEAIVVLDPDLVQQGRKQNEIAIIHEQGFAIVRQKTFQMSPGQAERFGGDPIRFAKGPCCVLLVRRNDDRSPYDALRELGLETIYFTESPYAALRARVALFPGAKQFERTFAIATGDQAVAQLDEIAARDGYLVTYREQRPLSAIEAAALEVELSFEQKTMFVLDKYGAVSDLQLAIGPPPSAIVASSSVARAENAIRLLWPDGFAPTRTLGLIKPDAVRRGDHIAMRQRIIEAGFTIIAEKIMEISADRARLFYEEHRGRPFYEPLVVFMSSGPLVALVLSRPNAVAAWRTLLGPTNANTARQTAPMSLRARYGTDGQKNAAHGSSSASAAASEIRFFFPDLPPDTINLSLGAVSAFLTDKPDFRHRHGTSLNQVLVDALTHLCRTKPVGLAAVAELGLWLRDHNPRRPKIITPVSASVPSEMHQAAVAGTVMTF